LRPTSPPTSAGSPRARGRDGTGVEVEALGLPAVGPERGERIARAASDLEHASSGKSRQVEHELLE
jgi:hypothetical protein